ncbi:hypothetical protein [Vibrio fortis]|uniref:hypothetical protein n=1 Tax=Vibrio fortis TaxID=212667 RepID=UPI0038CD4D46
MNYSDKDETQKQDLNILKSFFIESSSNNTNMVFNNAFAMACYLSIIGEYKASEKLLTSLFAWFGSEYQTTYFEAIFNTFHDNAKYYSIEVNANAEIKNLIDRTLSS